MPTQVALAKRAKETPQSTAPTGSDLAIMGDKSQKFCLKWTNYQHHLSESFISLLQTESMADVTLSAQGKRIHAHRIVLSVCSPLFQVVGPMFDTPAGPCSYCALASLSIGRGSCPTARTHRLS
uniref:BTB domain-containing protein n=1 Tax=Timema poppense TaxID=170557 RepID=A0A7R9H3Z9_TIMPO|nr:unnamed protein product [Timema poppensis]